MLISHDITRYLDQSREDACRELMEKVDTSSPIIVRGFYLPAEFAGIHDLPKVLRDFLTYEDEFPGELGRQTQMDLDAWRDAEYFVLDWAGGEHCMTEDGEVFAS